MYPVFASDTPQGAIDNCADKDEGDACDFMNSEGVTLDGFCIAQSDNKGYLACVPSE